MRVVHNEMCEQIRRRQITQDFQLNELKACRPRRRRRPLYANHMNDDGGGDNDVGDHNTETYESSS